jgi:2-hydroxy-6-oxonona-2,4-dienedioate hydrolase
MAERVEVEALGIRIRTRLSGPARARHTVVLVPGLAISGRYMRPLARLLEKRFRVLVPDPPGSGRSDRPSRALSPREQADVLLCWLRQMNVRDALVIGNSLACQTLLHLGRRASRAEIRGMVLVGTPLSPDARTLLQQLVRFAVIGFKEPLRLWWIAWTDYFRAGIVRSLQTLRLALSDRAEEVAPHVRVPVLLVRGSQDATSPGEWNRHLARLIPSASTAEIEGAAHALNFDAPRRLARLVSEFLFAAAPRATV